MNEMNEAFFCRKQKPYRRFPSFALLLICNAARARFLFKSYQLELYRAVASGKPYMHLQELQASFFSMLQSAAYKGLRAYWNRLSVLGMAFALLRVCTFVPITRRSYERIP